MSAYLIVKRGLYYRPDSQGYTGIKDKAGRYSLAEAHSHADEASGVTFVAEADAPDYTEACFHDLALNHLKGKYDALLAALTPSAETKAAYIGEFRFPFSITRPDGDDITFTPNIPWTTTKEIMAAIRAHAALPGAAEESSVEAVADRTKLIAQKLHELIGQTALSAIVDAATREHEPDWTDDERSETLAEWWARELTPLFLPAPAEARP